MVMMSALPRGKAVSHEGREYEMNESADEILELCVIFSSLETRLSSSGPVSLRWILYIVRTCALASSPNHTHLCLAMTIEITRLTTPTRRIPANVYQ